MQRNLGLIIRPFLRKSLGCKIMPPLFTKRSFQAPTSKLFQASCGGGGKLTPKMKNLMKKFQVNDGLPVFLKGGPMDVLLYRLTWFLCIIGLIGDVHLFFGYILA